MAGRRFRRADFNIVIRRDDTGGARLEVIPWRSRFKVFIHKVFGRNSPEVFRLAAASVRSWLARPEAIPVALLRKFPLRRRALLPWLARDAPVDPPLAEQEKLFPRVTLEIADRELAALPWEQALLAAFGIGGLPVERIPKAGVEYIKAAIDFGIWGLPVVRLSPVFPHVEDIALTLPMRFLHVDAGEDFRLEQSLQLLFSGNSAESVTLAVETAACTLDDAIASREKSKWPTAEVLQFDQLRTLTDPEKLLSTASPDMPGTLTWLSRLTDTWQTRLVVLRADDEAALANARRLLASLAARGGPAGLAIGNNAPQFLRHFYEQVIHDAPLDVACLESLRRIPEGPSPSLFIGAWRAESLRTSRIATGLQELGAVIPTWQKEPAEEEGVIKLQPEADQGRSTVEFGSHTSDERVEDDAETDSTIEIDDDAYEEGEADEGEAAELAVSETKDDRPDVTLKFDADTFTVGKRVEFEELNLGKDFKFSNIEDFDSGIPRTSEMVQDNEQLKNKFVKLKKASQNLSGLKFHLHESGGMLPLGQELQIIRDDFGVQPEVRGVTTAAEPEPVTRYVNASLWERTEAQLIRLKPNTDSPVASQRYQLGVQIGRQDLDEVVVSLRGLFKEQIKWDAARKGAWIEVGVTGLDFEVVGDPVQELWLPIDADSDRIHFTVVPRKAGIARLRYCIYNQQNLIQSHRLVAWVAAPGVAPPADSERREQLAQALGVTLDDLPAGTHYAWRCEYSLTADVASIAELPARTLSIAANDWNGDSVITVKGADDFEVSKPGDLKDYVQRVRDTLQRVSCNKKYWPKTLYYAFGTPEDANAADAERLREPLMELAQAGWELYDQIFPENKRARMEATLAQVEAKLAEMETKPAPMDATPAPIAPIIAVANILAEKVIPWSLLYSRKYSKDMKKSNGSPVDHDACLAAVPDRDGKLPFRQCRQHSACVLHPDQIARREQEGKPQLLEETVACPLHFWGFRHIIESPAQQASPREKLPPQSVVDKITSPGPPKAVAGFNSSLTSRAAHLKALQDLFDPPAAGTTWSTTSDRDGVVEKLTGDDLQVVYLFCHARTTDDTGDSPPCLEFDAKGFVKAGDLSHTPPWATHPLVFLNGCETAAFSPEALSPFVRKFVRDRGAAGVIGTEAPVWESLAAEFAEVFFRNFLAGSSAGKSLLVARRVLLSKLNPLGLTYTLYASAELTLKVGPVLTDVHSEQETTSNASV